MDDNLGIENQDVHDARGIADSPSFFASSSSHLTELKTYKMDHPNRGKAIIFNHEKFENSSYVLREGTEADVQNLRSTLINFGFEEDQILIYDDLKLLEILTILKQVSTDDHSDNDLLMVFVLTHGGNNDKIMAYDEEYSADKIWTSFSADKCKSLAEKPKIFFIVACRGEGIDRGIKIQSTEKQSETVPDAMPIQSSPSYLIPIWSDFLCVFSTYKGYYSYRNTKWGTWFVQAFCEQASKTDFSQTSFTDFLIGVNGHLARKFPTIPADLRKQVSVLSSTFTKRLFFTDKNNK